MYDSLGDECRQEQLQVSRHLARVEEDSGNNQAALMAYQEVMRVTKQEGLRTQQAWCAYSLGHLYNRVNRYPEALGVLKDAIKISRSLKDFELEAFATEESGYTAECQGQRPLAMDCYERALEIFKSHGEGKWIENEARVKKRMNGLKSRFPSFFSWNESRRWTRGELLNRSLTN